MIITNISNAILRNTQNLAKVSIFGGFAYGFIQTMKSGESALVPTSKWLSSHLLSSQQEEEKQTEQEEALVRHQQRQQQQQQQQQQHQNHQRQNGEASVHGEGMESSDVERRRVNTAVAWSSMR